ncbi:MAG: hypothetical protein HC888_05390 [Candidatus Competibacteraceae bacterium]|nr:hypothetical protein [Candidatus Competibacteraceae bacterium]
MAKSEGLGEVTRQTLYIKNNLVCVEVNFRDGSEDVYPYYRLYANGRHRGDSLVKLENIDDVDEGANFVVSSNAKALLAIISF